MSVDSKVPSLVEVLPIGGFDNPLTYGAKQSLYEELQIGSLVHIPLGARRIIGVISSLSPNHCPPREKLRFVSALVQPEPVLSAELVALAKWISSYYACSIENTLGAMIPASVREGMKAKLVRMIEPVIHSSAKTKNLLAHSPRQKQAYEKLIESDEKKVVGVEWEKKWGFSSATINALVKKGLVKQSVTTVEREAYADQFSDQPDETVESIHNLTSEQSKASEEIFEDFLASIEHRVEVSK